MTREELRDRLAPIYRQLRAIRDDGDMEFIELHVSHCQLNDSVVFIDGKRTSHCHFLNSLFRDWKPTEATR